MVDSFTPSLRIVQMPTGSNDSTWGDKADAAFAMLEQGIAGQVAIDITSGDHTLTTADNANDEARNSVISFLGTPSDSCTITVPDVEKMTLMINNSGVPIVLTAGAGVTAALDDGQIGFVVSDGATNVYAFILSDVPGHSILSQLYSHESL